MHIHGILCTFNEYTWNISWIYYFHLMNIQYPKRFQNFHKLLVWNVEQKLISNCTYILGSDILRIWLTHYCILQVESTTRPQYTGYPPLHPPQQTHLPMQTVWKTPTPTQRWRKNYSSYSCVSWCLCCCIGFVSLLW